jgi:hypothetical protein
MNETMSLLLATTVLALGGLGLYMFKSSDENQKGGDEEYNEEGLFGSNTLFNWGTESENKEVQDDEHEFEDEEEIKPRRRAKTHKNRKTTGSSRRRYY